jgi:predicted amidohydrolase YtcJ
MPFMNRVTVVLHGGAIYARKELDAVVIGEDRILAVGRSEELLSHVGEDAVWIDLRGRAVLPGFVDAHVHLMHTGLVESGWRINLTKRAREDVLECLRDAARSRGSGEWIVGYGWDESGWEDRRYLVRGELDRVSPENPALAIRMDGHLLTANSRALRLLPASAPESLIDHASGLLREAAVNETLSRIVPDRTTAAEALSAAARLCHRLGVTSVHTMSQLRDIPAFMTRRAERRLRVMVCPEVASLDKLSAVGLRTGFGDAWLRFGGIKIFADGSIGAQNAAVSEPFVVGGTGELNYENTELASMIRDAERAGWQTVVHAIGDRAIEQVLDAHRTVGTDPTLRHRMEHFELPQEGQLARAAKLGLCVSMQPNFIGNWSGPDSLYVDRLGVDRDRASNPLRRVVDVGLPLAFGSDGMPVSPLYGLHWAVNGPYPDQRLTAEEAVERYTAGGAWFGFEEGIKGRIEPGMLADLVVLDEDPLLRPERIEERTVDMTFVGGERVYEGEGAV